jgi:hypothetical protein
MRTALLSALTTALSTSSAVRCVQELPWGQSNQPLYLKNLKKLYLDQEYNEESTLLSVFSGVDVFEDQIKLNAYFAVDAKNPPAGLDAAVAQILAAKFSNGIRTNAGSECDYTVESIQDVLVYTFEFRVNTISY